MQIGDQLHLRGITRHGKNRVKQFGSVWVVKQVGAWRVLLETPGKTDMRWISFPEDENFQVTAVQLPLFPTKEN